jgi:hypothetical protein
LLSARGGASHDKMAETEQQSLYHQDFYTWAMRTAEMLRQGRLDQLDTEHLAEEVEDMGKSTQRELASRLIVLLAHLLKWQYQPDGRDVHGRSWALTVKEQRRRVQLLLDKNPGLKPLADETLTESYGTARLVAARETSLDESAFPEVCPYAFDTALADDFWPD